MNLSKLLYLSIVLLFAAGPALGQEAPTDSVSAWSTDLIGKLSVTQAGYQNWTEGGLNTLAGAAGISGIAKRTEGDWHQTHELRLAFGLVKQDTLDVRKADDVIRLQSAFTFQGTGFFKTFNPTVAFSARTQFAPGFSYDKNPFKTARPLPVKVSDFFSPATFTQSLGLTYDPAPWFTQRLGVAGKETVVLIERVRPLYNVDPDNPVRVEVGIESRTSVDREIFDNVKLTSSLGLFAAFNNPDVPDMLWENLIAMQVNSWLGVNFELVTLFDRDISDALQVKEVLSIGISLIIM